MRESNSKAISEKNFYEKELTKQKDTYEEYLKANYEKMKEMELKLGELEEVKSDWEKLKSEIN